MRINLPPKIDRRRHYILVLDTETCNTINNNGKLDMSNVLFYDIGGAVVDKHGNIYHTFSFVNADIYLDEKDLMQSAYYADKIPKYEEDLRNGTRKLMTTKSIARYLRKLIGAFNIIHVCAHNARFDKNALDTTQRWVTKSAYRYLLPKHVIWWDTMKMAQDVIWKMPTFKKFSQENGYFTATGRYKCTAEILYRFITKDNTFDESHTGLEDVLIEKEILAYCFRQHKKMRKGLYESKAPSTKKKFQKI